MTRPTVFGPARPFGVSVGGDPDLGDVVAHDCCDPTPPPDRALDSEARVPTTPTTDSPIVQDSTEGTTNSKRVLATPGTVGNTLIGIVFDRDYSGVEMPPLGGWTEIATGVDAIASDRACTVLYHEVEADETPYTSGGDELTYILTPSDNQHTLMFELAGTYDSIFNDDDNVASTTDMNAGGPVTPGAGDDVFILGAAVIYSNVGSVTEDVDVLSLRDEWTGFSPYAWAGYRIVTAASGAYTVGGTMSASHYAGVTAVFAITGPSEPEWDVPAPETVDGDDATYVEVDGTDVLRVDLGGLFRIVRARLLIGSENAGTVTYRIRGATEADFGDAVELDSMTFDVTGSFTADDIEFLWATTESYRYFELSGTNETRRIYSFELYEPSAAAGEDHTHEDLQDQIDDLAELDESAFPFWFNVETYGAVHDGATDDTTSIQDAIDACMAAGGGTVFFPNGIYFIDGALVSTSTYNSQLTIPQNALTGGLTQPPISIRFLGMGPNAQSNNGASGAWLPSESGAILLSSWNGSITGSPAVIAAGKVDALFPAASFNWVQVYFENIEIRTHANPKLSAIQMRAAIMASYSHVTISTDTAASGMSVPSNSNAIGIDQPIGLNSNPPSTFDDVMVDGYYTGVRTAEQDNGSITVGHCTRAIQFTGGSGTPNYIRHANQFDKILIVACPRALVFDTDVRWVTIQLLLIEHDDAAFPAFAAVYDIDDASNYARGFIGWHVTDYTTGPGDILLVNGATGLSLHGFDAKRWKLNNVVHIPTGTDPSTNPATGFFAYAASATGKPTTRSTAGTVTTLMREGDTAGGDLGGTYPNPTVADDSHSHTAATLTGVSGVTDHSHVVDEQFSGDAATTLFYLANSAVPDSVIAYVSGARTVVTLGGVLLDEITFGSPPASASLNISVDYAAASS